jgi:hypothetical protein
MEITSEVLLVQLKTKYRKGVRSSDTPPACLRTNSLSVSILYETARIEGTTNSIRSLFNWNII